MQALLSDFLVELFIYYQPRMIVNHLALGQVFATMIVYILLYKWLFTKPRLCFHYDLCHMVQFGSFLPKEKKTLLLDFRVVLPPLFSPEACLWLSLFPGTKKKQLKYKPGKIIRKQKLNLK